MKLKIYFFLSLFFILFSLVVSRAFYLQVLNREKLISYSNSQVLREVKSFPKRGVIYDSNNSPLAINVRRFNIFAVPNIKRYSKKNIYSEFQELRRIVDKGNIEKLFHKSLDRNKYTQLYRSLNLNEYQVSEISKLNNIFTEEIYTRYYPNEELLSQALGFVGVDNNGLGGLEYYFNKKLKGQEVITKYYLDAKGRPIKFGNAVYTHKAPDIHLSIDKEIQAILEKSLEEVVLKHKANMAGAGVMDVQTGEVWALANYPTYNPNQRNQSSLNNRKLSFITDPFEPGSLFKTITIAAALEEGIVNPKTSFYCEKGKMLIGKHYINESDSNSKFEWLTVKDILSLSSNIGTTKIAMDLGKDKLLQYIDRFGFNSKTSFEYPGESKGILKTNDLTPHKLSNISFGQSIATTGIQVLRSYAAIANGGYLVDPTMIKGGNKSKEFPRIINRKTSKQLIRMLEEVVENGTGGNAQIKHFKIAGKTSTAQRVSSNGGYDGYVAGFVGFPVNVSKRFVVFVYVDNPTENGYYGNKVAAPVFNKIVRNILFKRKEFSRIASKSTSAEQVDIVRFKSASVAKKYNSGEVYDFIGLDKKAVLKIQNDYDLNLSIVGHGIVVRQSKKPGSKTVNNEKITVFLELPKYD